MMGAKYLRGAAIVLPQQTEEQRARPDVVVLKVGSLPLREGKDVLRLWGQVLRVYGPS